MVTHVRRDEYSVAPILCQFYVTVVIAGIITALGDSQSTPVLTPLWLEQRDCCPVATFQNTYEVSWLTKAMVQKNESLFQGKGTA